MSTYRDTLHELLDTLDDEQLDEVSDSLARIYRKSKKITKEILEYRNQDPPVTFAVLGEKYNTSGMNIRNLYVIAKRKEDVEQLKERIKQGKEFRLANALKEIANEQA